MNANANNTSLHKTPKFTNANIWSTRQLVTMALLCAVGVLLSFVEFPLMPGAAWLKYDASAVPAMICGFAFGPSAGFAVGFVGAVVHGILFADFPGALMNILAIAGFVLPAAWIYRLNQTSKHATIGLVLSIIAATALAIVGNVVVTPFVTGIPFKAVTAMIVPIVIPFNLIKGTLNAILTLVVHKSIAALIAPKKKKLQGVKSYD